MLKCLLLVFLVVGAVSACSYKEERTVQAAPAATDAPAATTTTTTTKLGF